MDFRIQGQAEMSTPGRQSTVHRRKNCSTGSHQNGHTFALQMTVVREREDKLQTERKAWPPAHLTKG